MIGRSSLRIAMAEWRYYRACAEYAEVRGELGAAGYSLRWDDGHPAEEAAAFRRYEASLQALRDLGVDPWAPKARS